MKYVTGRFCCWPKPISTPTSFLSLSLKLKGTVLLITTSHPTHLPIQLIAGCHKLALADIMTEVSWKSGTSPSFDSTELESCPLSPYGDSSWPKGSPPGKNRHKSQLLECKCSPGTFTGGYVGTAKGIGKVSLLVFWKMALAHTLHMLF